MLSDTWDTLEAVIPRLRYKRGFRFAFNRSDERLEIVAITDDAILEDCKRSTMHRFIVPRATYNADNWIRWIFERLREVELHELREFFRVDEQRRYAPHHANGCDPYFEWHVGTWEQVEKSPGDD